MIPVFDNTRQNKILKKELNWAIQSVIESGRFILGPKVEEFEREFARYIGTRYAVGVASGTDAISLALLAVGVGMGDEIIMPANAYPSVFAVTTIGVIPKLVDIDAVTFNIDPVKIPAAITKKTKAIMPVHIYGQPADMEKILDTGKKYKIPIVEDCAQAHGAECLGKKVG
ncbi:aminotransferase class I/II-fold pyridoxal phosphate-dependent enzyme, partial [Candidatus Gottesmanbacteria bacterium]|nr:aminotransferase class I/II-fold pyridoxal phosphate-dependent enzyme [Candidatus Gottesmanbacteria bacterium]